MDAARAEKAFMELLSRAQAQTINESKAFFINMIAFKGSIFPSSL